MEQPQDQPDAESGGRRPDEESRSGSVLREILRRRVWERFRSMRGRKALTTALIVGGATVALATQVGAAELALGALAAYVAYQAIHPGAKLKHVLSGIFGRERSAEA
jgi:hypothetical protein